MPASRFECPRCQTVFVKDIGDAAFVECPSCGALALPAGDATEGYLERALSGAHNNTALASTEMDSTALSSSEGVPSDVGALAHGEVTGPGIFSGLLDVPSGGGIAIPPAALSSAPSSGASSGGTELDFDFGKDLDLELPTPKTTPAKGSPGQAGASPSSASVNDPFLAAKKGAPVPMPPVTQLPPDALAALSRETDDDDATNGSQPAPWSSISEDAFGDLEKAFDEMALKPAPPPPRGRLTAEEERFLRSDGPGASRPPPLRRGNDSKAPARPPPRRAGQGGRGGPRPRPTHFELSDEARSLAFIALKSDDSGAVVRPRLEARGEARGEARKDSGRADGVADTVAARAPASSPGSSVDVTERVRARSERAAKRPVPSAFQGLSALRVLGLVVVCAGLGGAVGALTAPQPKPAATARARAELRFADGNRFYDAGRYDDALGAFRGALSIDPTFGLAHRAKGAALAKLTRYDEAAEAYEEYLKLEPDAVDVGDVKAAIARRGPPTGGQAP